MLDSSSPTGPGSPASWLTVVLVFWPWPSSCTDYTLSSLSLSLPLSVCHPRKKGLKRRLGEQGETLREGIESLGNPSTEETEKSHASLGALWTASPPADFACNDEGAHTAFSQII